MPWANDQNAWASAGSPVTRYHGLPAHSSRPRRQLGRGRAGPGVASAVEVRLPAALGPVRAPAKDPPASAAARRDAPRGCAADLPQRVEHERQLDARPCCAKCLYERRRLDAERLGRARRMVSASAPVRSSSGPAAADDLLGPGRARLAAAAVQPRAGTGSAGHHGRAAGRPGAAARSGPARPSLESASTPSKKIADLGLPALAGTPAGSARARRPAPRSRSARSRRWPSSRAQPAAVGPDVAHPLGLAAAAPPGTGCPSRLSRLTGVRRVAAGAAGGLQHPAAQTLMPGRVRPATSRLTTLRVNQPGGSVVRLGVLDSCWS